MMAEQRLIDANALALEPDEHNVMNGVRFVGGHRDGGRTIAMVKHALKKMIANAPTIDAAPVVHARWGRKDESEYMFDIHWACSKCGQVIVTNGIYTPMNSGWHYCPNCGAKMDGGDT